MIALQIVSLFNDTYKRIGLPVFLFPYRVVATGGGVVLARACVPSDLTRRDVQSGVIECIPNCKSRDDIGRQNELALDQYFITKYGDVDSAAYQAARKAFIQSMAAYSIASYIIQV